VNESNHSAAAPEITAVILTYNESAHVVDCVQSLAWADRVVVFDSYSQDDTVELACSVGAEVLQSTFENYAQQRNAALQALDTDWVFFVDADERGTLEVAREVRNVTADRLETGWYVPRHNYIFGQLTRGAGWYPDYQFRLFKHGKVHYERPVHEIAVVDGDVGYLQQAIIHYNYRDKAQFQAKQAAYTDYDASILKQQDIRPRPQNYILQPWRQFWWRCVTLRGYQDGWHGFKLSVYMAYYEWVKYRKLAALWRA
jgi:glycosyltransferase involved in cell wall biosynthesis